MNNTAAMVRVAEVLCYLPLLACRWLARLLLLVVTVAPFALPVLAIFVLFFEFQSVDSFLGRIVGERQRFAQAVAVLMAVGLFAGVVKAVTQFAYDRLLSMVKAVWGVVREGWIPHLDIGGSIDGTRVAFAEIPGNAKKTGLDALLSTLATVLAVVLVLVASGQTPAESTERPEPATVERYVVIVADMDDTDEEAQQEVNVLMRGGAVFSLTHARNAQPESGEGMCLEETQQEWLMMYRAAILACLAERAATEPRPTFKVTAFASLAPVRVPGAADRGISDKLNCEIANRRAHAVGAFLAHGRDEEYAHLWRCPNVGEEFMHAKQLCIGEGSKVYEGPVGLPIDVEVVQWPQHQDMGENKPADDGSLPDQRRFRVEMLNRAVHIHVPENFCRASEA